ncbi:hypothetical protein FQP34_27200 [Peribacillus simplex]|uniref:Uncharacterized protein n=1 Tax=Peribacillus simplex TaxID=1478 RepID=A0A8B5XRJ1_9BACI|nr:hypothetical protein [Peribacillus simplex]TVX75710.1 hypothetical protein FQP34_27200 [Peribacillus simplex]
MDISSREKIREHAARDIAHRWFAYFEGKNKTVNRQLEILSDDIKILHASSYLLADGRDSAAEWVANIPEEVDSHFIKEFIYNPLSEDLAEVRMKVAYQVIQADNQIGGAIIHYQTLVTFTEDNLALFKFINKTPAEHNPNKVFADSYQENRIHSLIYRWIYLRETFNPEGIKELLVNDGQPFIFSERKDVKNYEEWTNFMEQLSAQTQYGHYEIESIDTETVSDNQVLVEIKATWKRVIKGEVLSSSVQYKLKLQDIGERYLKIVDLQE